MENIFFCPSPSVRPGGGIHTEKKERQGDKCLQCSERAVVMEVCTKAARAQRGSAQLPGGVWGKHPTLGDIGALKMSRS